MTYSKCLNCSFEIIIPGMVIEDDTNAHAARRHKVTISKGKSSRWSKNPSSPLTAFTSAECGYTALFAESYKELSDSFFEE